MSLHPLLRDRRRGRGSVARLRSRQESADYLPEGEELDRYLNLPTLPVAVRPGVYVSVPEPVIRARMTASYLRFMPVLLSDGGVYIRSEPHTDSATDFVF